MSEDNNKSESDIENFIDVKLFCYKVHSYRVSTERKKKKVIIEYVLNLKTDYIKRIKDLIKYLITL